MLIKVYAVTWRCFYGVYQIGHCIPKVGAFESRKWRRRFWNNGTPAGTNMSEPVESLSSIISESPYFCNNIESLLMLSMFDPSKQLWQGFFCNFGKRP